MPPLHTSIQCNSLSRKSFRKLILSLLWRDYYNTILPAILLLFSTFHFLLKISRRNVHKKENTSLLSNSVHKSRKYVKTQTHTHTNKYAWVFLVVHYFIFCCNKYKYINVCRLNELALASFLGKFWHRNALVCIFFRICRHLFISRSFFFPRS